MSTPFQPRNKRFANVKVVSSSEYRESKKDFRLVGCVSRSLPCFVTSTHNKKTGVCTFKDDVSSLTLKSKKEICRFFSDNSNSKKTCVYLVVDRQKSSCSHC